MKGALTLLLVFGAVAWLLIRYWSRRAVEAHREAGALYQRTGSVGETFLRLYQHERLGDEIRLSSPQKDYVDAHWREFLDIYEAPIKSAAYEATKNLPDGIAQAEFDRAYASTAAYATMKYAKDWCGIRGIK